VLRRPSELARLSRNFFVGSSRMGGCDLQAELGCFLSEELDLLLAVSWLVVFGAFVDVLLPILEHSIDQSGEAMSHVKGPLQRSPCRQTSDRQYRSHAYRRARSAMSLAALACRTESPDHTLAKGRTLDKFLALATRRRRS